METKPRKPSTRMMTMTMPEPIKAAIDALAIREERTRSAMAAILLREALAARAAREGQR